MKKRSKKEEEKLQEEIKKYANEPRSVRRKKERELKKKGEKRNKTDKIDIKEQSLMIEKI